MSDPDEKDLPPVVEEILETPGADFSIPGFMPEEWRRAWDNA